MFEALIQGFLSLFVPANLLMVIAGVLIGIFLGVIPGLGALIGISVILPMIFRIKDPGAGILILVAIHSSVMTGGVIPAILMGVPGAPTNLATLTEGYPMTQRGEGARALGSALTSSALGGIIAVPFAILMLPLIIPIVLAMGTPEMTLMILLGLSFLAILGGGEGKIKSLMAGLFGILISLIGLHDATGIYRYNFGSIYLADGISMLTLIMGMFAIGEIFDLFLKGKATLATGEAARVKTRDLFQGIIDVFRHWWLWFKSSVIGYIFGIIPGIGGTTSIFVCYAHAKQISKHPEQWGKGCIEGVIAPEAGNNSSVAGSVLTSLALGIPGDSALALILGAFLVFGITPGREMLTCHLELTAMLLFSVALANIMTAVICLPAISTLAKVAIVPLKYLFSILLVFIMVSSFSANREFMDMLIIIPIGVIGLCMKRFGYSLPCFILGFLLGRLFENYLWLSLKIFGPLFFLSSPITVIFIVILAALFTVSPAKSFFRKRFRR